MRRNKKRILFLLLLGLSGVFLLGKPLLSGIGEFLVDETKPLQKADAAVVLTTGVDYTARLIEAAQIYNKELVDKIVINGDRKSKVLQGLEEQGYREECHWSVNPVSVLNFLDVPTKDIVIIDAPEAYDTVSEAEITGRFLRKFGLNRLIVTTSKFHTRRAGYIWRNVFDEKFDIQVAAARKDPFDPQGWWRHGRQIRQVMAEYGAWFFYLRKKRL